MSSPTATSTRRPRLLPWAGLALASSCGLLFPAGEATAPDAGGAGAVAHLERVRGQVLLERGGTTSPAKLGYLHLKDALITEAEASANVRFAQGQLMEVGPNARFVIGEDGTGIVLSVERGLVLTRVPGDGQHEEMGTQLTILTPFGITRLGSGEGAVQVEVGRDGAQVSVLMGAVELVSRNGQSLRASAGEKVTLTIGEVQAESSGREVKLEPIQILVHSGGGRAEVRKQGQKRWKAVSRKGEALAEGDGVRVRSGRSALELQGSESRVEVASQTELVFQKARRSDEAEESSYDLRKGSLTLSLSPGRRSRVDLNGLHLESGQGGQFGVVKTKDGYDVQALAGDAKLTREGKEVQVQAGQSVRFSGQGEQVIPADRADVVLPTRSGMKVHHAGLTSVALSWSGEASTDHWVEVASDPGFARKILSGVVHGTHVNVPVPRRGTLHWRVLRDDRSAEVDRGSATFAPEPQQRDLARLRNEVQDGADKSTIFFQDKPPAVTFAFSPEEGAAEYRVQVYRADALDQPVVDRRSAETKLPLEAGALSEGSYVWSVTPLDSSGNELRGGKFNKMEISYDNSVPNLVITSPRNGEAARGKLRATGVAPVGARLYVNGKPAELDDKSRFDLEVSPVGRPPVVIFRVSRPPASDTITVRSLRRR